MANPIEETPILTGKAAEDFLKRMQENHKVSKEEYDKIMNAFDRLSKITDWS